MNYFKMRRCKLFFLIADEKRQIDFVVFNGAARLTILLNHD